MKKKSTIEELKACPNCQKVFTPNSPKQKFCSPKCKVAFARKTAKELGVTTADKLPKVEAINRTALDSILEFDKDAEHGKSFRQFAEQQNTDTDTLFAWLKDNYGKVKITSISKEPQNTKKPVMINPVPGTNAYFLRHGVAE